MPELPCPRSHSMSWRDGKPVLAACFNEPYVPHVATVLQSVAASGTVGARAYLVGDDSVPVGVMRDLVAFARQCGVDASALRVPDALVSGFEDKPVYPRVAWYRAVLGEVLPEESRLLYLDADLLVLHDLQALWSVELGDGALFGAVCHPSYVVPASEYERLRLPHGKPVLNSGVMVMDLERMRAEKFAKEIRRFCTNPSRPPLRYADQDAMNSMYSDRWTSLDPVWNAMSPVVMPFIANASWEDDVHHDALALERAGRSPSIVHFDGSVVLRPWHRRCFNPFADLYRSYRAMTPWPLENLQKRRRDVLFARLPPRIQAWLWRVKEAGAADA